MELSNEIVDLVDPFLLVGTFSKDGDPGYKAIPLRSFAVLDNDFSLFVLPKLEL